VNPVNIVLLDSDIQDVHDVHVACFHDQ